MGKPLLIFFLVIILALCYAQGTSAEQENMNKTVQIKLPQPIIKSKVSLEESILNRRSIRKFNPTDLSIEQLGQLLWAGQGITAKVGQKTLRSAPSAGAAYPMELYVVNKDGLFHYNPLEHSLEQISDKDLRHDLKTVSGGQGSILQAPISIIICGVYSRVTSKYPERGIRYTDIEVGHIAENIHLQAVSLGLGSLPIGSYDDEKVKEIMGLKGEQEPLYIIPIGYFN